MRRAAICIEGEKEASRETEMSSRREAGEGKKANR